MPTATKAPHDDQTVQPVQQDMLTCGCDSTVERRLERIQQAIDGCSSLLALLCAEPVTCMVGLECTMTVRLLAERQMWHH